MNLYKRIHLFLWHILNIFKLTFFRNRKIFKKVKPLLASGCYKNSLHCDYIFETNHIRHFEKVTFSSAASLPGIVKWVIKTITNIVFYRNNQEGGFGGTEIIISSSQQEYKVFSIENAKVLTFFTDDNKLKNVLKNKTHFESKFFTPQTLEVDINESYIIEQYIEQNKFVSENAFSFILKQYVEYAESEKLYPNQECLLVRNCFAERFGESSLLNQVEDFPLIYTHGDLWRSNIIFDGRYYYLTDFELAKPRYILFDLFCFIFTEIIVNNDKKLLTNYFEGLYDDSLSKILQVANLEFKKTNREIYLLAYLMSVTYERWRNYYEMDQLISNIIKVYIPNYNNYET